MKDKINKILHKIDVNEDGIIFFRDAPGKLLRLFQAQHEQDIKAFEDMIGEDEPLNIITGENARTEFIMGEDSLRAELRTKLDQYKEGLRDI